MKNPAMYLARSVRKLIRENFLQKRIDWTQAEGIAMDIVLPHSSIKNQGARHPLHLGVVLSEQLLYRLSFHHISLTFVVSLFI